MVSLDGKANHDDGTMAVTADGRWACIRSNQSTVLQQLLGTMAPSGRHEAMSPFIGHSMSTVSATSLSCVLAGRRPE